MTVAIDETGDFREGSNLQSFFVAAYIQSENGQLEQKRKQLEEWERNLPEIVKNDNGEVKGSFLNLEQIQSFLRYVIFKSPEVRTSWVSIVPSQVSLDIIKKHQKFEIRQIEYSLDNFIKANNKKKNVNFLKEYSKWLNKRTTGEFMKMLCLKNSLSDTFNNTFAYGIVNEKIEELLNINYKIDHDFLSNENMFWSEYARRSVQENSKMRPLPFLNTWNKDHPVKKKYLIPKGNGRDGINLNIVFKHNLSFVNSKENFEIRIADILGIIVNRYWNKNDLSTEYALLTKIWPVKDGHIHVLLEDFDENKMFELYRLENE